MISFPIHTVLFRIEAIIAFLYPYSGLILLRCVLTLRFESLYSINLRVSQYWKSTMSRGLRSGGVEKSSAGVETSGINITSVGVSEKSSVGFHSTEELFLPLCIQTASHEPKSQRRALCNCENQTTECHHT